MYSYLCIVCIVLCISIHANSPKERKNALTLVVFAKIRTDGYFFLGGVSTLICSYRNINVKCWKNIHISERDGSGSVSLKMHMFTTASCKYELYMALSSTQWVLFAKIKHMDIKGKLEHHETQLFEIWAGNVVDSLSSCFCLISPSEPGMQQLLMVSL